MRHLLIIFPCLLFQMSIQAQTLRNKDVFDLWLVSPTDGQAALKQKGFKEVYGGPKKEGGYLYLYQHKSAQEYLFLNYDTAYQTNAASYYVPTKSAYLKLQQDRSTLFPGEEITPEGRTRYEDGRKYYHLLFRKATPNAH